MITAFRRVLFLGAHPDDEFGCAGTLARLTAAGAEVDVVTFSTCADLIPDGFSAADLIAEWQAATALLGIDPGRLSLHDVPNRFFPTHRQQVLDVLIDIRDRNYDLVLLPTGSDVHQDHSTVSAEGVRAFKHSTILGYELAMNTVRAATFAGYVRLEEEHVELKVRHAATYRSQAHRIYMDPAFIRGTATVRGVQAGVRAAEAFEVIRAHW
jgi:LmbE family N-acetylglucosaminyl deacetylase